MRRALISTLLFFIINDGLTQVHNPSDALNLIKKIDGANKSFKVIKPLSIIMIVFASKSLYYFATFS